MAQVRTATARAETSELLEALATAIVLLDSAGVVRAANLRARELFGGARMGEPLGRAVLARQNYELARRINLGAPCELLLGLDGGARRIHVRIAPYAGGTLLEAGDVTDATSMRRELQASRSNAADLQAANEELLAAYEEIETGNEQSQAEVEAEAGLNQQLFQSNLELMEIIQGLQRRVAALEKRAK